MIALDNVSLTAGAFTLTDVSLEVPTGGYVALMGKTGSGKTTLLEAICGLRKVTSGAVRLSGEDVTPLKPAQRGLGYVPQDRALFQSMTVWEHLAFALRVRRWDKNAIANRVSELAQLLGLERLLARKPQGLSGGEAQRVALGRALSFRPRILLLDEPLSALDQETRGDMQNLLRSLRQQAPLTTLHVTHDLDEARRVADKVLVIRDGKIHEHNGKA
ncbi:MAG: ATP-binding cassette domain-containing protein [Gemmataceae bacterium]|nr:ATP-binding cassette domain-containing protein [Gemmataceae bacterium]MCI0737559.1 ATP-binding cassette domain-containing protein [Gemmataceae bacterium]